MLERRFEQSGQHDEVMNRLADDLKKVGVKIEGVDLEQSLIVGTPPTGFMNTPGATRVEVQVEPSNTAGKLTCTMRLL